MNFCALGLSVIETEAQAILSLTQRIDERFSDACALLLACQGRVIVTGMGKSGHIGRKLAATLASTGTPAFFMHPGEASHGDCGMITSKDTLVVISYSGATPELVVLLPVIKRLNVPFIALTGHPQSILATSAHTHLDVSVANEACPLGLAPTTSTTAALVMGDALAISLLQARGFSADDFARSHPGGVLGRRLLLRIDELCHGGDELPQVRTHTTICDALLEVNDKKLGMTCVVDDHGILKGVFTDGDIRRTLTKGIDIHQTPVHEVMTQHGQTLTQGVLAVDALTQMQNHRITSLVVMKDDGTPYGVVHMHDLLRAGVY